MPSENKFFLSIFIVILLLASFIYFYKKEDTNTKTVKESSKTIVRVGYMDFVSFLPYFVAQEKGLFEKRDLVIESTVFQSSNQMYEALLRGDIDFTSNLSSFPVLRGELIDPGKIKFFGPSDYTDENPFDLILAKKDSPINSIQDLTEKKIGVFPGTTSKNYLKKILKDNNVDISEIEFIELPPSIQLTTLYSGGVDAVHSYEPNNTIAITSGNAKKIFGSVQAAALNHNPFATGVISKKFIDVKPEAAKKAVAAIYEANEYMAKNENETREIAKKIFKLNDETAQNYAISYFYPWTEERIELFEKITDIAISMGEIDRKPNIRQMVYTEK
jgi:NitT/TauT family transport system substrate-binding protein